MLLVSNFIRNLSKNVLFLLLILFLPVLVSAQSLLPNTVSNTLPGGHVDYTIPSNITQFNITLSGAEGGGGRSASCEYQGGLGATIEASFSVGFCSAQSLTPGGLLRLITGSMGGFSSLNQKGASGGGGSALLYKAPQSTNWIILAAAGGGGGAYFFVQSCSGANGGDAQLGENGGSTAVSGGTNGDGGKGGGIISFGGGGAFSDGYTLGNTACSGKAGFPNGAAGGNCGGSLTTSGGYGFGSGAAGADGGGGGGGYSGGAGGNSFSGGGGGGSFISTLALQGSTSITANRRGNGTISIVSTTGTVAQPVSLASATLEPISVTACNISSFQGSGAAYAYSIFPVAISLAQFNAAGGVISNNSCGIQSITYVDAQAVNTNRTIFRTFTVTDINNSSATCTQVINLERPPLSASVSPAEQTVCVNVAPALISISEIISSSPPTIQWWRSESPVFSIADPDAPAVPILNATSNFYSPPSSSEAKDVYYFARISDQCGNLITLRSKVSFIQTQEWVLDQDVDGYYTGNKVIACSSPGSGYVVKSTQLPGDCKDDNAAIKPGATEVRDGIDNNCDGNADEGFPPIDLPASPTNLTSNTPGVTDYTIPTGITFINFTVQGAKGGSLNKPTVILPGRGEIDESPDGSAGTGGLGARMRTRFTVDANCEQGLKPGGIIRLIVGATPSKVSVSGTNFGSDPINYGQGGGGGSSILYKAPGSTQWIPLVVAGGGGGAAAVVAAGGTVTPSNGQPGIALTSNASTGTNGLGGRTTFTTEKGGIKGEESTIVITAGGGGGMSGDGKTIVFNNGTSNEISDCGGGRGLDAGADGGVSAACPNGKPGGAGFGAGGSGNTGGGGGGGYSGGNAGAVAIGGFGAGSYISSMAQELPLQDPSNIANGWIFISSGTTATGSTLAISCPGSVSISSCNTDAVETATTLAFSSTDRSITEQELIDAGGTVSKGACAAIATIAYKDVIDAASTSTETIIKRTFTVTDTEGAQATCTQTITITDDEVPVIAAVMPINTGTDAGVCNATLNIVAPSASDNCKPGTATGTRSDNLALTAPFPKGTTTITWNYSDGINAAVAVEQVVTVSDDEAPVIAAVMPISTGTDAGVCNATLNIVAPSASDNCKPGTATGTRSDNLALTAPFPKGTTTITWNYSDGINAAVAVEQVVTVTDDEAPTITAPAAVNAKTSDNGTGDCTTTVTLGAPVVADNCTAVSELKITNDAPSVFPIGTTTVTWTVEDKAGLKATATQQVTVRDDEAPKIISVTSNPSSLWPPNHKMKPVTVTAVSTDNCGTPDCKIISVSSNEPQEGTGDGDLPSDWEITGNNTVNLRAERSGSGNGRIYTITVECRDASGNATKDTTNVMVSHNITAPQSGASYKIGSTVSFAGTFWDVPGTKHTARWVIDNSTVTGRVTAEPSGLKNGTVTGSYKFSTAGVYKLRMEIIDQFGNVSYANTNGDMDAIVVIYDPNGGYAYGGGKFYSEAGAQTSNPAAKGMVSYGFQSNYFKTATYPKGETQFEFKVGDFEFNALNYEYLVISGAKAQFRGSGKITNGQSGVSFIMTVIDGAIDGTNTDKIRMKVFNKNTNEVYYDNQPGASDDADPTTVVKPNSTVVIVNADGSTDGGGSTGGGGKPRKREGEFTTETFEVITAPNPSDSYFTLTVKSSNTTDRILVRVMDELGRVVEQKENVMSGTTIRFGDKYIPGMYFIMVQQGKNSKAVKLIRR